MNDTVRRSIFANLMCAESAIQESDHWLRAQRMHVHIHVVQSLRNVALTLVGGDIPEVAERVFHAGAALAAVMILWLADRSRACLQSLLVGRVCVLHLNVQGRRVPLPPERLILNYSSHPPPRA